MKLARVAARAACAIILVTWGSVSAAQQPGPADDGARDTRQLITQDDVLRDTRDVTSATRTEEPAPSAPTSISVMGQADLRRLGVRYVHDALRIIPGMEVVTITSTDANVSARGYNDASSASQGMLAVIDGRLAYNEFYGNVLWPALQVSLDEIDRIEVVKGPASFLYGPNALHGFVNISTLGPLAHDEDFVNLTTRLGTYDSVVSSMTYVHRTPDSGFKTTLVYDDIDQFEGLTDENTRDKLFGEIRLAHKLGTDEIIEVTGGTSEQKIDLVLPELEALPVSALLTNDVEETFVKANYTKENFTAQLFWTGFDSTSDANIIYQDFTVGLDTVDLDLLSTVEVWEEHTTTIGAGGRFATFDTNNADVSEGRHDTTLVWGSFQDVFELGDDVTVTAGGRMDFHSVAGTNVSPRVAAVWNFKDAQFLRASIGSGFRNPSLRELWFDMPLSGPGAGVTVVGNDDLDAESIHSFELGYASEFKSEADRTRGSSSLFYNRLEDRIVFELVGAEIVPENTDDEESYGLEMEGEYRFKETLSGLLNYSYTEQRNRDTDELNQMNPRHKANTGLRYWAPGGVSAMLWVNYFDETEFEGRKVDEYFLVSGSLSRDFTWRNSKGRVFLEAFNLLDNDHKEHPDGQSYGLILQLGVSLAF